MFFTRQRLSLNVFKHKFHLLVMAFVSKVGQSDFGVESHMHNWFIVVQLPNPILLNCLTSTLLRQLADLDFVFDKLNLKQYTD